jgi:predicted enzyme related to lactoylglutathione lyase
MEIRGVDFIVHYVPNLEEAVSFYRDTLCLKLELHNPAWNWAEFSLSPITLVLFGTYQGAPLKNGKGGAGLALAVDDFDATIKELSESGVEVEWGPNELSTCHVAMITDPGGNPIFIHRRKDGSCG